MTRITTSAAQGMLQSEKEHCPLPQRDAVVSSFPCTADDEGQDDDDDDGKDDDDEDDTNYGLIFADLIIPGRGEPLRYGAVAYSVGPAGRIEYVGSANTVPPRFTRLKVTHVPVLMPGLWDCHVHLMGSTQLTIDPLVLQNTALAGARTARDLAAMLNAGYTSCRELAGYGWAVAAAVDEGWLPGPHVYSSVSILSQTAGHGDAHSMPLELVQQRSREGGPFYLCDGVDECVRAVRTKIRQGAAVIKVAASGGVLSILDDPQSPQFSPEELGAVVREAAKTKRIVAAHCHGKESIVQALNAGCRTIEHGTYMDDECVELMKEKGAILVATRSIVQYGAKHADALPPPIRKKMLESARHHKDAYKRAIRGGVRCALGTDMGISSETGGHVFGMNGRELWLATEAGMSPLQAIESATANAPDTLGGQAPQSGRLEVGYDADFIALSENPLDNITVVADVDKVTHVWKGGRLYKKPGHPVGFFPVIAE